MNKTVYKFLLAFSILSTLGGLLTLLPVTTVSYPNILGYRSLCTFTPASTFFCFLAAGTSCFFRSTFIKDGAGTAIERMQRHSRSFIMLGIVLLLALGSTAWFSNVKSAYTTGPDAETGASVTSDQ